MEAQLLAATLEEAHVHGCKAPVNVCVMDVHLLGRLGRARAAPRPGRSQCVRARAPGPPAPARTQGMLREKGGERWRDPTLDEWPKNDHRIFVGNIGNDVTDDILAKAFQKYPSFAKAKVCARFFLRRSSVQSLAVLRSIAALARAARWPCATARLVRGKVGARQGWCERALPHAVPPQVVRNKRTMKSKVFGFVSFLESADFLKALKEMNGKYIGNRPCQLRKSTWEDRAPSPPPAKKQKKQHQQGQ